MLRGRLNKISWRLYTDSFSIAVQRKWRLPKAASTTLEKGPRRLMRNCGRSGRGRDLMLVPNLLPKAVPHNGPRLLPGFVVRPHRRLVEGQLPLACARRPGRPALLSASEVLTLAILAQWPRFRSERDFWRFASSHLRPTDQRFPGPTETSAGRPLAIAHCTSDV